MKAILIVALLFVSTLAVTQTAVTNAEIRKIQALQQSGTWGGFMLNLGELHLLAQGPVDALVNGIEEVLADLERKHTSADEAFEKRTNEHESEVRRLTSLINEARRNIADTQQTLANVLRPQEAQLQESIADRERFITETQQYMVDQTAQRALQHSAYLTRIDESTEAVEALNECLELLSSLNQDNSFAQIKKAQRSVEKLTQKLGSNVETSFIKALVQLANSEFANSAAVNNVINLMEQMRTSLTEGMINDTNDEEQFQKDFQDDMTRCSQELAAANEQLQELNDQLDNTQEQIATAEQYIVDRTADLAGYNGELDDENAAYEEATNQYNDLINQFNKEEDACKQALDVLQGAVFADYISNRMGMDKVIDSAQDRGIKTGAGSFDFQGSAPRIGL